MFAFGHHYIDRHHHFVHHHFGRFHVVAVAFYFIVSFFHFVFSSYFCSFTSLFSVVSILFFPRNSYAILVFRFCNKFWGFSEEFSTICGYYASNTNWKVLVQCICYIHIIVFSFSFFRSHFSALLQWSILPIAFVVVIRQKLLFLTSIPEKLILFRWFCNLILLTIQKRT